MSDLLDKRVTELETLVWDVPNLLNVRFARFETELASLRTAISDNTGRLTAIERAMFMIQTDMRDLRGGVTRQLIAQDERIASVQAELATVKADVSTLKSDVATLKADVATLKADVATLKSDVATLRSDVATLRSDVAMLKSDVGDVKQSLAEILRRLPG